jgi:hypothetical protein
MTSLASTDLRLDDAQRSQAPVSAADQAPLVWLLDPSSGTLFQCRTMAHTGPSTAKLFG